MFKPRKLKRRHLIYYLRVFEQTSGRLVGHVVDITPEGVKLVLEKPIEPKSSWRLQMTLPESLQETHQIAFQATCVWCDKDINPDFFVAGMQIEGLAETDKKVLEELIREFGFND